MNFAFQFSHCLGCGLFPFSDCLLVLYRFIVLYQKIQTANNIGFEGLFQLGGFGDQENFLIPLISISFEGCRWLCKFKTPKRKKTKNCVWHSMVISEMSTKLEKEYFEEQSLVLKLFIHDYAKINWQDQTQTTSKFFGYSSLFKTNQNKVCAILPVLLWKGILGIDES